MPRMYHPSLGREVPVPDDDDCVAVYEEAGWKVAPEPEVRPGYAPEPVEYAPVEPNPEPEPDPEPVKAKRRTKTDPAPAGEDSEPEKEA